MDDDFVGLKPNATLRLDDFVASIFRWTEFCSPSQTNHRPVKTGRYNYIRPDKSGRYNLSTIFSYMQLITAFIKRDFLIEKSYRFNYLLRLLNIFFYIVIFYFLSQLFGKSASPYLLQYGSDYFAFVIIGLAFSRYLGVSISAFSSALQQEQLTGTIEMLFATPVSPSKIIILSSLWQFLYATIEIIIYFLFGVFIFGLKIYLVNINIAIILILLTVISFSGLGLISAACIMLLKRGDPVGWLFCGLSELLGGVYFPLTVLPTVLQKISYLLPITYSLNGLRKVLLTGSGLSAVAGDIFALFVFSVLLLPAGLILFNLAVKKVKLDGTLGHY